MQNIHSESELQNSILVLENKQAAEARNFREQFQFTGESLQPANLIRHSIKNLFEAPALKGNVLNSSLGLTAGLASKLLYERGTHNPLKKIVGNALLFGVTNIIGKNIETIKSVGSLVFGIIRRKNPVEDKVEDQEHVGSL